jgi:hypothetical protein
MDIRTVISVKPGLGAQSNYIKKQPATFTVMVRRLHFNNRLQVNQPGILLANDA